MGINTWVPAPTPLPPPLTTPSPVSPGPSPSPPASAKAGPESAQIAAMGEGRMASSQEREGPERVLRPPSHSSQPGPLLPVSEGPVPQPDLGSLTLPATPGGPFTSTVKSLFTAGLGVGGSCSSPGLAASPFAHLKCSHLPLAHVGPCPSFRFQPKSDLTHPCPGAGVGVEGDICHHTGSPNLEISLLLQYLLPGFLLGALLLPILPPFCPLNPDSPLLPSRGADRRDKKQALAVSRNGVGGLPRSPAADPAPQPAPAGWPGC